ncbi:MAG: hypothetical protein AAF558_11380 [Verrucomicrobiota bacterium]
MAGIAFLNRTCLRGYSFCVMVIFGLIHNTLSDGLPKDARLLKAGLLDEGKAEINRYDASFRSNGKMLQGDVVHVWVKEPWNAKQRVKWEGEGKGDFEVIKLNQITRFSRGVETVSRLWSGIWVRDSAEWVKWTFSHQDFSGSIFNTAFRKGENVKYNWAGYLENQAHGIQQRPLAKEAFFYEELPLKLRLIVYKSLKNEMSVSMVPPHQPYQTKLTEPFPAKIQQMRDSKQRVSFTVKHSRGQDVLIFDRKIPFKLLEWKQFDGSHLKLTRSEFKAYWEDLE